MSNDKLIERFEKLVEIGIALSTEIDTNRLLEMILVGAKAITNADGGTLYLIHNNTAKMEIIRTDSLQYAMGGTTGKPITFPPISLYTPEGTPNLRNVVTYAVHKDTTVNIQDAYVTEQFDFSGTRKFDSMTGYRSTSFLTVPLKNHEGELIGVLQLLNALNDDRSAVIPFDSTAQRMAEALASQAAVSMTKQQLINELETLFRSLIQLIAHAIDEKSPYTGGHCRRIPILSMLLAEAVHRTQEGPFKDFTMTDKDRHELEVAAWLHDCGKITTPEYVVDKAAKLETIFDRIHLVDARLEVLKRDAEIALLRQQIAALGAGHLVDCTSLDQAYREKVRQLDDDREFIHRANIGGEFMSSHDQERVRTIGRQTWYNGNQLAPLLSEEDIYNLTIPKGTLNPEERQAINHHVMSTINMLQTLPFPKHLKRVPEFAGGHHERIDGKGYPKGLTRDQMSVQARIIAIADIFEALTAPDRPYRRANTLSQALKILATMKAGGHVDPDLFKIFVKDKVYLQYAEHYMDRSQIDEVDSAKLLA
jgi:HD-GYP domain-containing protein (c-di-GMP phosphodiesterase class II)